MKLFTIVLLMVLSACAPVPIAFALMQVGLSARSHGHIEIKTQEDAVALCEYYAFCVAYHDEDAKKILEVHNEDYRRCMSQVWK